MKKEALLKTKTDKKQFLKWIDALKSGKFQQTRSTLQDSDGYCCLGVACKVIIPKHKQELNGNGYLIGLDPDHQISPKWLKNIDQDFHAKSRSGESLIRLNDSKRNTFKQIANKLERVYKKELEAIK